MNKDLYEALQCTCQGSTQATLQGFTVYFKHFGLMDHVGIEEKYKESYDEAKSNGVPTEKDQLDLCISNEVWSQKKEDQIEQLKRDLKHSQESNSKMIFGAQKKEISKRITAIQDKLYSLLDKRNDILGITSESIASKRANEFFIYKSAYKDLELNTPFFKDDDEFYDAEEVELGLLISMFQKAQEKTSSQKLKKIAISPIFMNLYRLAKAPHEFFDRPILSLTFLQQELLSYAENYKVVLSEPNIPDSIKDDPDKLIDWYNSKQKTEQEVSKKGPQENNKRS